MTPAATSPPKVQHAARIWGVSGLLLVVLCWCLSNVGHWTATLADPPRFVWLTSIYIAAGVVLLAALWLTRGFAAGPGLIAWIVLAGLMMRLGGWADPPQFETDYHRFLWDGAVTANGFDPFSIRPIDAMESRADRPFGGERFARLVEAGRPTLSHVNHPHLTTIYPPVAQGFFAWAYRIDPFSPDALRGVYLAVEIGILLLLLGVLRSLSMPLTLVAIYWWNPVAIKEFYVSAHMDALAGLFAMGAVAGAIWGWRKTGLALLGLAVGVKIWPMVLAPVLLRWGATSRKQLVGRIAIVIGVSTVALWPLLESWGAQSESGLSAYANQWVNNAGFFSVLYWGLLKLREAGIGVWTDTHHVARIVTAGLVLAWMSFLWRRRLGDARNVVYWCMVAVGGVFLISPTQFPWYYTWVLPLLVLAPATPLLLYTALLPLYHLQYTHPWVLWAEHLPVWALLGWTLWRRFRTNPGGDGRITPKWAMLPELSTSAGQPRLSGRSLLDDPAARSVDAVTSTAFQSPTAASDAVVSPLAAAGTIDTPPPDIIVTVIIPALNEERAIGQVLANIPDWATRVIVADNGSTDATSAVARSHGAIVVREPTRGYGAACLAAIGEMDAVAPASGDGGEIVVFLDGDFSDDPREMGSLVMPIVRDEADLVIGSRVLGNAQPGSLTPPQRFGNWLSCGLMRLLYGARSTDLGPFRAIRRSSLAILTMDDRDYGWTVQMQVRAARRGMRCVEVPVSYRKRIGVSKVSGTVRGVIGAGTKILSTLFREGLTPDPADPGPRASRLIILAKYPQAGLAKTRMIPLLGPTGAAMLHRQLVHITLDTARRLRARQRVRLELRYTGASASKMAGLFGQDLRYRDQRDGDLGRRMHRAVSRAIGEGAPKVIVIGTDCPSLNAAGLERAMAALDAADVVLGPAVDGGYYLIGLKTAPLQVFTGIDWGGPDVLSQTLDACRRIGLSTSLLPTLPDVDTPADLCTWASSRLASVEAIPEISIVIPARNEQDHLAATLASALHTGGVEIVVVDGDSSDRTAEIAGQFGIPVVGSIPSRGRQLNLGAAATRGNQLLFLHADTRLPTNYASAVRDILAGDGVAAGAFTLGIDADGAAPRIIELGVRLRSSLLARPYGDQALFVTRSTFNAAGGFDDVAFMEDYAILPRLQRLGRIVVSPVSVRTSARRWQSAGWLRTTLDHQRTILRHHFPASDGPTHG